MIAINYKLKGVFLNLTLRSEERDTPYKDLIGDAPKNDNKITGRLILKDRPPQTADFGFEVVDWQVDTSGDSDGNGEIMLRFKVKDLIPSTEDYNDA